MEYYLDGSMMTSREEVHEYIREQIEIPYGNNLDALYDILTSMQDITIYLSNTEEMIQTLGTYGYMLLKVLRDAEIDNEGFTLKLK